MVEAAGIEPAPPNFESDHEKPSKTMKTIKE